MKIIGSCSFLLHLCIVVEKTEIEGLYWSHTGEVCMITATIQCIENKGHVKKKEMKKNDIFIDEERETRRHLH